MDNSSNNNNNNTNNRRIIIPTSSIKIKLDKITIVLEMSKYFLIELEIMIDIKIKIIVKK